MQSVQRDERACVFYSEGSGDAPHLAPIIHRLSSDLKVPVVYATSESADPLLQDPPSNVKAFYIGSGVARMFFFKSVEAKVVVMTLPDLEKLQLKRSVYPVHYVYVFHALCSTHMIYRKGAFDAYDTVLCAGPHHVSEIRRTESLYNLAPKRLIPTGYVRLDSLLERTKGCDFKPSAGRLKRIVVAPTWGTSSLIEQPYGEALLKVLLDQGHDITLRLHPMTVRRFPKLSSKLYHKFRGSNRFHLELLMPNVDRFLQADIMITDWSCACLDFALALERPVLFVDTEPKVNNPDFHRLGIEPIESRLRQELGSRITAGDVSIVEAEIQRLCGRRDEIRQRLRAIRNTLVYNLGSSASIAANAIRAALHGSCGKNEGVSS